MIVLCGRLSSFCLMGVEICCLIFFGVMFGIFSMILICVGEILGNVLIGRFRYVYMLVIVSMFVVISISMCWCKENLMRWGSIIVFLLVSF